MSIDDKCEREMRIINRLLYLTLNYVNLLTILRNLKINL